MLTPMLLRMHAWVFNEPPQLWHCWVLTDLQEGWHYQSLPLWRQFEHTASVASVCLCLNRLTVYSRLYVSAVFVLSLLSMPARCLNRFVERRSRWHWTGFKFEQACLIFWGRIQAQWPFNIFLFQTVHEHSFVLSQRIQNFISIHSCNLGGVFLEINWLTSVTMEGWFSDS